MNSSSSNSSSRRRAPGPVAWARARAQVEAGDKTFAQIAEEFGVSVSTVARKAGIDGWAKDPELLVKIAAQRQAILAEKTEREHARVVAITAAMQSQVLVAHRKTILQTRELVSALLSELTAVSSDPTLFNELGELMANPDDRGIDKLNTAYKRVLSIPSRASTINTLATALRTLIALERQAFNIEGTITDPEEDATSANAAVVKGLDKIMDKFNEVLSLQVSPPLEARPHVEQVPRQAGAASETPLIIDVSAALKTPVA